MDSRTPNEQESKNIAMLRLVKISGQRIFDRYLLF
jgi:hypothetical protein